MPSRNRSRSSSSDSPTINFSNAPSPTNRVLASFRNDLTITIRRRGKPMKIVAMMPCRNDAWCMWVSARVALKWCDEIVILNHASTDDTRQVIRRLTNDFGDRVGYMVEFGQDWNEATDRQRLLEECRRRQATHIALVDADELLTRNLWDKIRDIIQDRLQPGQVLKVPWIHLWRSVHQYRADESTFGRARVPMVFQDSPHLSYQAGPNGYQFHRRYPIGSQEVVTLTREEGGVLHLQHASWRRLQAKQALYKLNERIRWGLDATEINHRYDPTVNEEGALLRQLPGEWIVPNMGLLQIDSYPWQEAEVRRLWKLHGAEKFAGLNLYGVCDSIG